MKKTMKRLLALGMTLSIAVGMFPVTALAANDMPDSYDFRGKTAEAVKTSWTVAGSSDREDTSKWSVGANGLTLTTHNGDIYGGATDAKNIFVQKSVATDDWVAETMITLGDDFDGNFQQGAILAYGNDNNYVKLSYEYNNDRMFLQLASEVDGTVNSFHITDMNDKAAGTFVYLQLIKTGTNYSAKYSTDGETFVPVRNPAPDGNNYYSNAMLEPRLAITANNGGGPTPEANKDVTFAYVAAMTAEQAALETTIAAFPAVNDVDEDDFTDIKNAYTAYSAMDAGLRDTVVSNNAKLKGLMAEVTKMEDDMEAAAAVVTKINAIGEVALTDASKDLITEARTAYTNLTADQKGYVTAEQLAVLTAAEAAYDSLAAADVDAKITAIGTVDLTPESKAKIDAARSAYDALTDAQKDKVTKLETMTTAEAARTALANKYDFVTAVADIGTTITKDSKAKIDAAEAAYAKLTDAQKAEVSTNYATLTTAKTVYGVVEKIHAIGIVYATDASKNEIKAARDAYNALTSNDLKAMVGNYATLQNAEKAQAVVDKIAAIGTVAATSACKTKIAEARSAFDALTSTQEAMVGNETTLLTAEADYVKALINDIGTVTLDSKAKIEAARTAYKNLTSGQKTAVGSTIYAKLTAAEAALADLTAADAVDAKIDAIGTVAATSACKAKIDAARAAYDALTAAQKALVKDYDDLQDAERLYALLAALEGPCDGGVNCPAHPFTDVNSSLWYHEAVDYVLTEELFKGVSATQFAPNGTMTRAMIWTVLARMDDATLATTDPWYASAQRWAVNNQVSDGTTPNGSVTREQLVTMLWRFVDEPNANGSLAGYPDAGKVSSWAKEAMTWAVANGVVQGVGNANGTVTLNPGATATRAQVAQMFMNFLTK